MSKSRTAALSREGRDTLWLLGILALAVAPHLPRLPLWCAAGTLAAIAYRAYLAWRDAALPARWVLLVGLAVSMGLTLWQFHTLFGREAGVTLVTLLAALKTLELRARRDAFVITSLGFFLILTQFLYSQSLPMAALMLLVLLGLLSTLVLAQQPMGRPAIGSAVMVAARSLVMGIPVMLALYVLFPRLGPLWSVPSDAGPRTGLSDRIDLGQISDLAQDDSVAMHVRFMGAPPPQRELYFRGPVLEQFDGRTWSPRPNRAQRSVAPLGEEVDPQGAVIPYQITFEPLRMTRLPLLDGTLTASPTPPFTEPRLHRQGLDWTLSTPLLERAQIDARAWQRVRHGPQHATVDLETWLQLPLGLNPGSLAWAHALQTRLGREASAQQLSEGVLTHIRQGGFRYTLNVEDDGLDAQGRPDVNLIDRFWLYRKTGFCEHFATAYVVIMRAMGIPSRVVTGFQGGEMNPVDGLYVVRNSDAHAWAEYWQAGEGWVRVDPTAAVDPARIERPRPTGAASREGAAGLLKLDPATWSRLRDYFDAGNHRWNMWVLQYTKQRQLDLLRNWGLDSPDWVDLARLCGLLLALMSVLGVVWLWWTRPRERRSPWRKPLWRVHKALVAAGLPPPASSPAPAPALNWALVIDQVPANAQQQALQPRLREALTALDALRYGPQTEAAGLRRQRSALVAAIEQQARQWRALARRVRAH